MPKIFSLVRMSSGQPDFDPTVTPVHGWVHCDSIGNWGAYLVSGTAAQLTALNALPQVVGLVAVTEAGDVRWAELDNNLPAAIRTRLNTWLTARGYPTIPTGWSNRRGVREIFQRFNARFDLAAFDVADG